MNIHYLTKARALFNSDLVPQSTNRHNQRAWIRSVRLLGRSWLGLSKPLEKLA